MRWLIYALGGGYGHVTRALSLAKIASARNIECTILYNSELVHRAVNIYTKRSPRTRLEYIPSYFDQQGVAKFMGNYLGEIGGYDRVIVDTFPRGIAGELSSILPKIRCPKILIHRYLNEKYVKSIDIQNALNEFDEILMPRDSLSIPQYLRRHSKTEPWLICSPEEILSVQEAQLELNIFERRQLPTVAFLGTGSHEEMFQSRRWAEQLRSECQFLNVIHFSLEPIDQSKILFRQIWPVMKVYRAIDLLVCSGGYNALTEASATQTRTIVTPRKRRYDRQDLRANEHEQATNYLQVREKCELFATDFRPRRTRTMVFENGANEACDRVEKLTH